MARRLKVYGGHIVCEDDDGSRAASRHAIIAAPNRKVVADAIGSTVFYVTGYWSETGNAGQIMAALRAPGVVLVERPHGSGIYFPFTGR